MKKLIINLNEHSISLGIGISSSYPDYSVAYFLNKHFRLRMEKQLDLLQIESTLTSSNIVKQKYFRFFSEEAQIKFLLIQNNLELRQIWKEFHGINFFLFLEGEDNPKFFEQIVSNIKRINIFDAVFVISHKDLAQIELKELSKLKTHNKN